MKTVQIIDGADNADYALFRATEEEFRYLFPAPGQDIELIEDVFDRHHPSFPPELLAALWARPVHKRDAGGIDGTLYYGWQDRRRHLPASKREIDRDPSQINQAQRDLYARLRTIEAAPPDEPLPALTAPDYLATLPGGAALQAWFDGWTPSFHDAEILELVLDADKGGCRLRLHTWLMTDKVDAGGFYVLTHHVAVTFALTDVSNLELEGYGLQNIAYSLTLSPTAKGGVRLELDPCQGLGGFLEAGGVEISLEPWAGGE